MPNSASGEGHPRGGKTRNPLYLLLAGNNFIFHRASISKPTKALMRRAGAFLASSSLKIARPDLAILRERNDQHGHNLRFIQSRTRLTDIYSGNAIPASYQEKAHPQQWRRRRRRWRR
jgi:hypothetical protein